MFRKAIVISHAKVPNSDLHDFPMLVSLTDEDLRTMANGGHVSHPDGEDISFTDGNGGTQLAHEMESYDPVKGTIRARIRVPKLSHDTDTVTYICYGGPGPSAAAKAKDVWDANYKMVRHGNGDRVTHSDGLNLAKAITVEAWVQSDDRGAEALQAVVSKWRVSTDFDAFDGYDAGNTSGMNTTGFFGAVFDGRYVYFVPQHDGTRRHGKVTRYDTRGDFHDAASWVAYDAGKTSGLNTKGYYGAVSDGRYIFFVPRLDGEAHHSRVLRYDTRGEFTAPESWRAFDAGDPVSHQSAAFDGRYIYFVPGYENDMNNPTGRVLRYDTHSDLDDPKSYATYDASRTSGLDTTCYDGAVFDGRYVYFAPLNDKGMMLRHDTQGDFLSPASWQAYNAKDVSGLRTGMCVGAVFDGRYVYYTPYAHSVAVRFDTHWDFTDEAAWEAYEAANVSGVKTKGYDGAVFDGRYVYFLPFWDGDDHKQGFHGRVLRYDATAGFCDAQSWSAADAGRTGGLDTVGFNGGAFDGRYIYFAPWRGNTTEDGFAAHGNVLRYDTTGADASFSLRYADCGHNGGLCAALPGPAFLVNTDKGVLNVRANTNLEPGKHHLAGVYDGERMRLFVDGVLAGEQDGTGAIQRNNVDVTIGRLLDGLGKFKGDIFEVRISDIARSADWVATQYNNLSSPSDFCTVGEEESLET